MTGERKKEVEAIIKRLKAEYSGTTTALDFKNPYELLVATCLAAQCTDARVNKITEGLFKKYPSPKEMAAADLIELQEDIKSCGIYKNKAKNLIACAQKLNDDFSGEVPGTLEELTTLAGVGRKTANVVLAFGFGIPAMPVDTHVKRVANRLGLADSDNPDKVEESLKKVFKKNDWIGAHHWLLWHGRRVCKSQRPMCSQCILRDICPSVIEVYDRR